MNHPAYHLIDETSEFLVIYKNPNISFNDEENSKGLFHILKCDFPNYELHAIHRLDKVTSGILIVAKNKEIAKELSILFQNNLVEKYYLAISEKKPKKKQGKVIGDMERTRRAGWKLLKTKDKPAITQFFSYSLNHGKRLFILKPKTGKTHQLRVMMKSLGSPILGDVLYTGDISDRVYLHAYHIRFTLNSKSYSYTAFPTSGTEYITQKEKIETIGDPSKLNWPN